MGILAAAMVLLTWATATAQPLRSEVPPVEVDLIWTGDAELYMQEPPNYKDSHKRLIELARIGRDEKDSIIFLAGETKNARSGYKGYPVVLPWNGSKFVESKSYNSGVEFQETFDIAVHGAGVWAGQGTSVQHIYLTDDWMQDRFYSPGGYGLPVRSVLLFRTEGETLYLMAFASSFHTNPGMIYEKFRFFIFRPEARDNLRGTQKPFVWFPKLTIISESGNSALPSRFLL